MRDCAVVIFNKTREAFEENHMYVNAIAYAKRGFTQLYYPVFSLFLSLFLFLTLLASFVNLHRILNGCVLFVCVCCCCELLLLRMAFGAAMKPPANSITAKAQPAAATNSGIAVMCLCVLCQVHKSRRAISISPGSSTADIVVFVSKL